MVINTTQPCPLVTTIISQGIILTLKVKVPGKYVRSQYNILASTKNASLIITDFLAMIYKNEQPRTASLCRGWAMLDNDFNLICRRPVIHAQSTHDGIVHRSLMISI